MPERVKAPWDFLSGGRAAERLANSESRFRAFVTATSDVVFCMSPDWSAMRYLEGQDFIADTQEPSRSWLLKYIPPEEQELVSTAIDQAIRAKSVFELEHRVLTVDGSVGWALTRAVPLFDEQGEIIEWFCAARDVTKRKAGEQAFAETQARARQLDAEQNHILEMIAYGRPLQECLYSLTESVTRLSSGLRSCVLVANENVSAISETYTAHFPPSFGEQIRGASISNVPVGTCGSAIRTGQPVTCTDIRGSDEWSSMWKGLCLAHDIKAAHSTPIFGTNQRPIASFFLCLEETRQPHAWEKRIAEFAAHAAGIAIERDRAIAALHNRTEELQAILDLVPVAVWIAHDPQCREIRGNRTADKLYGVSVGTNVSASASEDGLRIRHVRDGRELVPEELPMQRAVRSGEAQNDEEINVILPDGRMIVIAGNAVPLRNPDGGTRGAIGAYVDITARKAAEEALRASEERLGLAIEGGGMGTWDADLATGHSEWSARHYQMLGYQPSTDRPATLEMRRSRVHPDDLANVDAVIQKARESRSRYASEHRIIRADNDQLRWFSEFGQFIRNTEGEPVRFVGISIDVTERKEAELRLARSQKKFQELIEHAPFGIYVVDSQLRIAQMNLGSQRGAFRNVRPVIGRDFSEAMRILWPEPVAAEIIGHFRRTLETGEPFRSRDFVNQRSDTETTEAYEWELYGVTLADGTPGVVCYYFDSTELRSALRRAAAGDRLLQALLDYVPEGITVAEAPDVNITAVSRYGQKLTGKSASELGGPLDRHGPKWEFCKPDGAPVPPEELPLSRAVLKGEVVINEELTLGRVDGTRFPVLCNAGPLRDDTGGITGGVIAWRDISDLKRTEQELRQANQDLEQFAYSASHDLQEPLRTVKIFSQLLSTRYRHDLDSTAAVYLDNVHDGATRMEMLVRDLLTYSQVAQLRTDVEPVSASLALDSALANLAAAIAESSATIHRHALPSVPVHAMHLQQLFQNLIGNAIKYRKPGIAPIVNVSAERRNSHWLLSVDDNGIGIEPEFKERIFGLFKRLHTGDQYSGTGIGLALCQRIVERYRGRIWVDSTPGQGSTFYFTLPG